MRKQESRSPRSQRHRITLRQLLTQCLSRLGEAVALAEVKSTDSSVPVQLPNVPELDNTSGWANRSVELLTAELIAKDLGKHRTIVSRMLKTAKIMPIYFDGKTPLYPPSVVEALRHPLPARACRPGEFTAI